MTLVRWRLGVLVLSLVGPRTALPQTPTTVPATCTGHTSGIWVAVGGKDRYALGQARRIPPGELVALRGYPLPPQPPVVTLRLADETSPRQLAVSLEGECGWWAPFPSLRPNAKAEIRVTAFTEPSESERRVVREVFIAMLHRFLEGVANRSIRSGLSQALYTQSAEAYLTPFFPPESTLRGFVLIPDGRPATGTLGAQLVRLISEADSLEVASLPASYRKNLANLDSVLNNRHAIDSLPPEQRRLVLALASRVRYADSADGDSDSRIVSLLSGSRPVLPISEETALAIRALIPTAQRNPARRAQLGKSVDTLRLSLEQRSPALFSAMYAATESSFQLTTVSGPLLLGDLLRYGTVDFLTGQIWNRRNRGSENRGFVTFSFFPTGPQSRTPESVVDDPTESGRYALSVGYSVTGGKQEGEEEPEDFFLAGLTVRANRYISATFGFVSPESGGGLRCCFAGVAGDITAVPFLSDLFAVNRNAGK